MTTKIRDPKTPTKYSKDRLEQAIGELHDEAHRGKITPEQFDEGFEKILKDEGEKRKAEAEPKPIRIQVHPNDVLIVIDEAKNTVHWEHQGKVRDVHRLNERWIKKYRRCRICKKSVSNEEFAFGLNRFVEPYHPECRQKEELKHYACCKLAKRDYCVCLYSTVCPKHGRQCHGSHD